MKRAIYASLLAVALSVIPFLSHADSLYREQNFHPLVGDRKAFRPGDSLTVLVFENASAVASADTTTEKKGELGMSAKTPIYDKNAAINLNDEFTGRGRIQRSGKLLAQITVTVQSIETNGELNVKGEQLIEVNSEKQSIKLEGRIRPSDISETNTVPSNRLADARISYIGDGILGEKQKPGILTRILSWLGLL